MVVINRCSSKEDEHFFSSEVFPLEYIADVVLHPVQACIAKTYGVNPDVRRSQCKGYIWRNICNSG